VLDMSPRTGPTSRAALAAVLVALAAMLTVVLTPGPARADDHGPLCWPLSNGPGDPGHIYCDPGYIAWRIDVGPGCVVDCPLLLDLHLLTQRPEAERILFLRQLSGGMELLARSTVFQPPAAAQARAAALGQIRLGVEAWLAPHKIKSTWAGAWVLKQGQRFEPPVQVRAHLDSHGKNLALGLTEFALAKTDPNAAPQHRAAAEAALDRAVADWAAAAAAT
jgi:hypothetical protein